MPDPEPFNPIAEARRQRNARRPEHAGHMAAVTSVMRVQQLLLARVEDTLKPYGLTIAAYEALRLLAFARPGSLPRGKTASASWPAPPPSPTPPAASNSAASSSGRCPPTTARRPRHHTRGRALCDEATAALNQAAFGLPGLTQDQAAHVTAILSCSNIRLVA